MLVYNKYESYEANCEGIMSEETSISVRTNQKTIEVLKELKRSIACCRKITSIMTNS